MVDHADEQLAAPGGLVGAQVLQPTVAVKDTNDGGQVGGHLVHQVKPDGPEQRINVDEVTHYGTDPQSRQVFSGRFLSPKSIRKRGKEGCHVT